MKYFVTYDRSTGKIVTQMAVPDGQEKNYPDKVMLQPEQKDQPISMTHKVRDGQLVEKTQVRFTADRLSFVAGSGNATISCSNLAVAGSLFVGESFVAVSPGDPNVTVTSDMPRTISVRFITDPDQYSPDKLVIEAT